MPKLVLELTEDFDFDLIGICSHIKDYRLVWELKKCDYLFLIKGNLSDDYKPMVVKKIAEIKNVLATYEIEVEALKSKENLVF